MRLLIVVPWLRRGGAERVVATLSRYFAAAHETHLLVFDSQEIAYAFGGTLIDLDLKPARGVGKLLNVFWRALAVRRQIRSFRPDLVLSFMESANFPVIIASFLTGSLRQTFVSVRHIPAALPWYFRWAGKVLYQAPAGVVGCSAGVSDSAKRVFSLADHRVHTIVNPVDVAYEEPECETQHSPPCLTERPYFVAAGRLVREKGFDVLLKAWKVSELADSYNLLVLGEGPLRSELAGLRRMLCLEESVHFRGAVASPFPIMQRAVAFVFSSRQESWGNALAEAMALGVPVISTNCEFGPAEIIRSEDEGLLVPAEDPEALGQAMRLLSEDASLRRKLSAGAKERTAELSPQRIASEWLALARAAAG